MNYNNKYFKKILVFIVFAALVAFVFVVDKNVEKDNFISKTVGKVVGPVSRFFRNIGTGVRGGIENITSNEKDDIETLNLQIKKLEQENRKLRGIVYREEALKNEFEMTKMSKFSLLKADITSINPSAWFDVFIINVGLKDGVEIGDTVVTAPFGEVEATEGLVGKVTEVFGDYSEVTAVTDSSMKVSIKTNRSGDGGVVSGFKNGELMAYMFDQNSDVIVGDEIMSSGLGEVLKKDIFVGKVTKVESDDTLLKKIIYISPAVDFKHLNRVYLIK